jgi:hypothetical protein
LVRPAGVLRGYGSAQPPRPGGMRKDGRVTDADPRAAAIDALYRTSPEEFVARRDVLVAEAAAADEPAVAAELGRLRRPTRSAWIVNVLVGTDPGVVQELIELGDRLRAAQRRLDGVAMRELTRTRRSAVTHAVGAALNAVGLTSVSESIRGDVTSTLDAAVADPALAAQVLAGRLVRPLRWAGFGDAGPDLTVVTASGSRAVATTADRRDRPARPVPNDSDDGRPQSTIAEAELESARRALRDAEELHAAAQAEVGVREKALVDGKAALAEAADALRRARIHERNAAARVARQRR